MNHKPIETSREKKLVIVAESEGGNSLVMIDERSHESTALEHVPDLDRVASARDEHVRRRVEEQVLDRLAVVHAQNHRVRSAVD